MRPPNPPPSPPRFAVEPLEARIAPAAAFSVVMTDPAPDAFVGASPVNVTVDFSSNVLLPTLQASDLTINGVAASSFSVVDGDTVRFALPGPLSAGTHTLAISAGAIQDTQGTPIEPFSARFTIDQTAPRVISSSIQPGAIVAAGQVTYVVQFNEPLAAAQIGAEAFALFGAGRSMSYAPAAFSFNEAGDTLTITYANLPDDAYQLTLLSGDGRFEDRAGNDLDGEIAPGAPQPIVSGNGMAGGDFVLSFRADVSTAAFPEPLLPLLPEGSLVQQGSVVTHISTTNDVDSYTIALVAGQKFTVVVESEASLRAALTVRGPEGNVIGSSLAPAAGGKITIQTIEAATSGLYTLRLGSQTNTTGLATIQVLLNTAVETEQAGGGGNETRGTAQNFDGSFVNLGGNVSRGAVLGTTDLVAGALPNEVEPNNTIAQANTATANFANFSGNLYQLALAGNRTPSSDVDFFNIGSMQTGDVLTISMAASGASRGSLTDALVRLYRGSATAPVEVISDDDGGSGTDSLIYRFQITANDIYYIAATGFSTNHTGTYQLGVYLENSGAAPLTGGSVLSEVEPNNTASAATNASSSWRPVQYLSRTSGTITTGDVDTYRYFFNAGDLVTVNIDATSGGLFARAALLDANGSVVAAELGESTGPSPDSPIYAFRIPSSGTYFVQTQADFGTGAYNADVYLSTSAPPPAPASGVDFHSFTLAAGETASIGIKALAEGAVQIELQNAGGSTLAFGAVVNGNVDSTISQFAATTSGTYYVRVTGEYGVPYSLVVMRNGDFDTRPNDTLETAQPLGASGLVLGGLSDSGLGRLFTFDDDANTIREVNPVTGAAIRSFPAPGGTGAGVEYGLATTPTSLLVAGAGSLLYELNPDTGAIIRTISFFSSVAGLAYLDGEIFGLTSSIDPSLFVLDYATGAFQRVVEVEGLTGGIASTGTALIGMRGDTLHQIDPQTGATTALGATPQVGAGIGVLGNELYVGANGRIDVLSLPGLDPVRTLTTGGSLQAIGADSGRRDVDFYSVQAAEIGSTLVITATPPAPSSGALLRPILDLYDPSGSLVASSDGGAAEIIFTTAAAGTHTVQVRTASGAGDYLLQVFGANAGNDAPILRATEPVSLSPINEDHVNNSGTLIRDLIASGGENFIVDPDAGAEQGIAVIGAATADGAWEFTTDGGATWLALGAVSASSARLLASDAETAIRFVPAADFHGEVIGGLTFRAWDQTSGANGQLANITATGGGSAFSAATGQAGITVAPVNDAPVFIPGSDQIVVEDSGARVALNWATGIAAGPANETGQQIEFVVTTLQPELFEVQPAVSPDGTLTYTLAPDAFGAATVSVILKDDGGVERGGADTSAEQIFVINIVPVNDAPENTVPDDVQQARQGVPLVFSAETGNAISISDIDAGDGLIEVRLEAASGAITLSSTTGLSFSTGDGLADATLVFTGTLADINAALDGLTFTPAAGFIGATSLQITTDDRGNTGGGSLIAADTIPISVTPVISFAKKVSYTDSQGNTVKVQLKGKGTGEIWLAGPGPGDPVAIAVNDSTAKSKLKISTARGAESSIGGIIVDGSLKSIKGPKIDLTGDLTVSGTLGSVKLDDVTGSMISLRTDSSVKLGKAGKVSFKFDRVAETSIATNGLVIKSLRATEWQDNEGPRGEISAPAIGKLAISGSKKQGLAGDFEAGLELTGSKKTGREVLGAARISGGIMSEGDSPIVWNLAGAAGKLLLGDVAGLEVNAEGFIGNVTADRWSSGALAAKSIALLAITGGKSETRFPGGFGADLSLSDDLVSAVIGGGITGGVWTIGGNAALIVTRGIDAGWTATITGNVGTVKVLQDASGSLTAAAMGAFKVGGDLLDASIIVHQPAIIDGLNLGNLGRVAIGGVMQDSSIDVSGSISSVKVGGMQDSRIFAGVRSGLTGLPELRSDFVASSQIAKLTVTGGRNAVFENSHIAAASLGSALVRGVQEDNGGVRFGIAADAIASLKVRYGAESAQPKSVSLNELSTAGIAEQRGDFIVRVV